MSITYPLSLPSSPGFSSVRLSPRSVVGVSESPFTFSQQVQQHQGQRWEIEVSLPKLTRAEADEWNAFRLKLNGRQGTFLLGDPAAATPRGTATGTPLVNGASQTGNTLITDGWTTGVTGILKAGDYIQLGTGASTRLHKVLDDANSDGSGNATLTIWPNLRTSPADNASITVSSCKGTFRMASNEMPWDTSSLLYGISFACEEAL